MKEVLVVVLIIFVGISSLAIVSAIDRNTEAIQDTRPYSDFQLTETGLELL